MSQQDPDTGQELLAAVEEETEEPPMYRVLLHNDDFTTKEFVVSVLTAVFGMTPDEAARFMWNVHKNGVGVCGVYPFDIADTKIRTVTMLARENGFPLKTTMEKE